MVTTRALIAASMASVGGVAIRAHRADGAVAGVILLAVVRSCEFRVNGKVFGVFAAPPRFFAGSGWVFVRNVALDRWELIVVSNQYNAETGERKPLCFWESMREEDVYVVEHFQIEDAFFRRGEVVSPLRSTLGLTQ